MTETYTYYTNASGKPTNQVKTMKSQSTGRTVTYTYTYDDNGNILSVSDGTNKTTYVYDSANQLIRENNQAAGQTLSWSYDRAGNMVGRGFYNYSTGDPGAPTDTWDYGYNDSSWGDLLTEHDGNSINSDSIGNIVSFGKSVTYTWEHGRQLQQLTHEMPLVILKQPEDFYGISGDEITISCEAYGSGLTYRWQTSTNGGSSWHSSGADGCTTNTIYGWNINSTRDGYLYRCKITDSNGYVLYTEPAELILVPIIIDRQPEDFYGDIGEAVSFSCEAHGTDLTYKWQVSTNGGRSWNSSGADGSTTNTIYGWSVTNARYGYMYRCKITDSSGNVVYTDPAAIIPKQLVITKHPENFAGTLGNTMLFSIEAKGSGLSYQWQFSTDGSSWYSSHVSGYNTPTLQLVQEDKHNGYYYRCKVTDSSGNVAYSEPGRVSLETESWQFSYDADGLRTQRSNGSRTYTYVYNGGSLSRMTVDTHTLDFTYDASGTPISVTYDGTPYFYATNLQGDVLAILNSSGTAVVSYTYDAWGNHLSITGSLSGTLGYYNPLRYRGYVYDPEFGLYYLQSRYYNAGLGRFNAPDAFASTGQGILGNNMYAYCNNNPANKIDPIGAWTISFSIGGDISLFFFGVSISIGIAFDDDGNVAVQWSHSLPNYINDDETYNVGVLDAGVAVSGQITDDDTISDLEGPASYAGVSAGDGLYGSVDMVFSGTKMMDEDSGNKSPNGIQFSIGYGVGVDAHFRTTQTKTIIQLR